MNVKEVAMIAVVSAVALCLTPDACTRSLIVVALCLVVALAHSGSVGMEYDRGHAFASARRASASSTTPASNEATALPKTRNPRHLPVDETSSEGPLPKTDADEKGDTSRNYAVADPYAFAYSSAAMQARRDEFVFRGEPKRQSTESHMRMLDDMYRELLDTSIKTDIALRPVGRREGDGCEPLRGSVGRASV